MGRLTKTKIDAAKPKERDYFLWDSTLPGFGVRIFPSGKKTYLIQYRRNGRTRRFKIGGHGVFTVDQARKRAKIQLGRVADGKSPLDEKIEKLKDITVSELCDLYLKEGCFSKRASTIAIDKGRIERHIKPLLGSKRISSLDKSDIEKFLNDVANGKTAKNTKTKKHGVARVRGGKGTATRTVGLFGGIYTFAIKKGLISFNPVHGIKKYPDNIRERYLTADELKSLGEVLVKAEKGGTNIYGLNLIKLLLLTGCRRGELLSLKWKNVNLEKGFLRLPETKTGYKTVPLGEPAIELLNETPKISGTQFVFPGAKGNGFQGLQKIWSQIRNEAGLEDVRLHDLRHTFASVGATSGSSLYILGKLLGHKDQKTTQRYAHLADDPLKNAADEISKAIADAMGKKKKLN